MIYSYRCISSALGPPRPEMVALSESEDGADEVRALDDGFFLDGLPITMGSSKSDQLRHTIRQSNIAMENGPFEEVSPIQNGGFPLLC